MQPLFPLLSKIEKASTLPTVNRPLSVYSALRHKQDNFRNGENKTVLLKVLLHLNPQQQTPASTEPNKNAGYMRLVSLPCFCRWGVHFQDSWVEGLNAPVAVVDDDDGAGYLVIGTTEE